MIKLTSFRDKIIRAPRNGGFRQKDYWVWGSSVFRGDDGLYHMYVSRWRKELPFFAWMTDSEIVHAVSETPCGPYSFSDVALSKRDPAFWDGQSCHNPKIVCHDNRYFLFYMGSTHPYEPLTSNEKERKCKQCIAGFSNKRIGLAVAETPYGPWLRFDAPILPVKPGTFYSFYTSNPSPVVHSDGSVLLMFKSRAYEGDSYGRMYIGLARAENILGTYEIISKNPAFGTGCLGEIEDPSIWQDSEGYHMLAKDMTGIICGEHHAGILCHSEDGMVWIPDSRPLAYTKEILWDDGRTETMGQLDRVFPLIENGRITALFFAVMNGPGGFDNGTESWNVAVPVSKEL